MTDYMTLPSLLRCLRKLLIVWIFDNSSDEILLKFKFWNDQVSFQFPTIFAFKPLREFPSYIPKSMLHLSELAILLWTRHSYKARRDIYKCSEK